MENISTIGMDIGKKYFYICGMNKLGKVLLRKRLYRSEVLSYFSKLKSLRVGIEACAGAHYWGRELENLGHEVKLMPPQYVTPYVKRNKNDTVDAEACAEAVQRPEMRFVAIKTKEQQELCQIHNIRERLIKNRTALSNELRGFLGEYGVVISKGRSRLRMKIFEALEKAADKVPDFARNLISELLSEFDDIEERIAAYEKTITRIYKAHPVCQRLGKVPGVGPIVATAIVSSVPDASYFKNSRQFSAYLGLTPREHTTGGKIKLGGISKRGNSYLRKQLIQGANAVINWVDKKDDPRSLWLKNLRDRKGRNKAVVAQANKTARIIWAMMFRETEYLHLA